MARLATIGFEVQGVPTTTNTVEGPEIESSGSPTITTSTVRSGAAALSCAAGGAYVYTNGSKARPTLDRTYFARGYFRFTDATPAAQTAVMWCWRDVDIAAIVLKTDGTLALLDANAAQVGSASSALSNDTWYRIEIEIRINTAGAGVLGFRLDGTEIARSTSADVNNTATGEFSFGQRDSATTTVFVDDIAINDDQGASQNSFPGDGKIVMLKPASDNAIGVQWQGPQTTGTDTTNIFDCCDNTPPLGVAHSDTDANANKYIFCPTSGAAINYDANMQTYTAAGIGAADTITVVQPIIVTGGSSATDTAGALDLVSNPDQGTETSFAAFDNGVAGTWPATWRTTNGLTVYDPAVTKSTAPVLRVGKRTATTRVAMVALMGIYVEYVPGVPAAFLEVEQAAHKAPIGRGY